MNMQASNINLDNVCSRCGCWIGPGTGHGYPCNQPDSQPTANWLVLTNPACPPFACSHCFCQGPFDHYGVAHRSCCKCWTRLAEQFALAYHGIAPAMAS